MSVADSSVLDAIKWSEALDDIFIQNYFSDPGLSFQYFGSSLGFMRSYPGEKC
jgi:voltage-dependent calcium channel alpha-2/delta-4